jgi:CHAD domain-containing protein
MIYELSQTESAGLAARRVASEQLTRAIEELTAGEGDADANVHSVRKRMKKLRGLLRLIESGFGRTFQSENITFRDAGRRLAGARRGAAVLATFDALVARYPGELAPASVQALRAQLADERDRAVGEVHAESHASEVSATLAQALGRVTTWPGDELGVQQLEKGLRRVYARARRGMSRARRKTTTENLHQWRKWAKYHFYHVRLLQPSWPGALEPLADALEALTEDLGAEHDLDDLRQLLIERMPPEELALDLQALLRLVERRRDELRAAAFVQGARLFADRPKHAARRFRAYYEAWRSELQPPGHLATTASANSIVPSDPPKSRVF